MMSNESREAVVKETIVESISNRVMAKEKQSNHTLRRLNSLAKQGSESWDGIGLVNKESAGEPTEGRNGLRSRIANLRFALLLWFFAMVSLGLICIMVYGLLGALEYWIPSWQKWVGDGPVLTSSWLAQFFLTAAAASGIGALITVVIRDRGEDEERLEGEGVEFVSGERETIAASMLLELEDDGSENLNQEQGRREAADVADRLLRQQWVRLRYEKSGQSGLPDFQKIFQKALDDEYHECVSDVSDILYLFGDRQVEDVVPSADTSLFDVMGDVESGRARLSMDQPYSVVENEDGVDSTRHKST